MRGRNAVGSGARWRIGMASLAWGMLIVACGGGTQTTPQKTEVVFGLRVQKVQFQSIQDELEVPGNVIAVSTAQVAARTMGTAVQVPAREGDTVKRGQVLAQLDERELSARRTAANAASQGANAAVVQATKALASAQAQAVVVQKTYDRYVYLKQQNSVSPQEFDEIAAKQESAQASLEQAKASLQQAEAGASQAESESRAAEDVASYARIVAPFDGRVIRRSVEPGSLVSPGMGLFVVEDTSHYQLEATLPAASLKTLKKSMPVRVQLDALGERPLAGKVAEMEAGADPSSHTLKARIDLPKDPGVQSGMFGRAFFSQGEKQTLMLPREAIMTRGQLQGIYAVTEGSLLHWRVVTLGKAIGREVEVLSGLNDGEAVVLNPGAQELDGKRAGAPANSGEKRP
jgi:RND family efflux transporter MFP subunit